MEALDQDSITLKIAEIKEQIADLHLQKIAAEATLRSLQERLAELNGGNVDHGITAPSAPVPTPDKLTREESISLFMRLFQGREDVYPLLWEGKTTGSKGYSPACAKEVFRG